jgi:hypothetical protein
MLPKIDPLPGAVMLDWKRCGKRGCRCVRGELHGPYFSRRWRQDGRQRRVYVRPHDLGSVETAVRAWRQLHPPARALRERLRELRQILGSIA